MSRYLTLPDFKMIRREGTTDDAQYERLINTAELAFDLAREVRRLHGVPIPDRRVGPPLLDRANELLGKHGTEF